MTTGKKIEWALRLGLGGFFVWSGAVKLMDLPAFLDALDNYKFDFLEEPRDAVVAYTLPWVEVVAGLAVISGLGRSGGLVIILGMLMSFCLALTSAWNRGLDINCGCGLNKEDKVNYPLKLAENGGLFLVALVLLVTAFRMRRNTNG